MHRVVAIHFTPRSAREWHLHGMVRGEAAHLWARMTRLHARIRRANGKWPSEKAWRDWAKRKFPRLHSQSIQEVIGEFLEAVNSCRAQRKAGDEDARYPWRRPRYRHVPFTQTAVPKNGVVRLPCGRDEAGKRAYLEVRVPDRITLPGRVVEGRLEFCKLVLVCEIPDAEAATPGPLLGVDLGVNTLIAATDGHRALLVSGRGAKALIQLRNKRLAEITSLQSRHVRNSRRWKDLQRTKRSMLARIARQLDDLVHKATRLIASTFPNATAYVGTAFNDAARKQRRRGAQLVSQAVCGKITRQLQYKLANACSEPEHYTSQTCPVCLERKKQSGRFYRCDTCRYRVPRDVVGGTNIRTKGRDGRITRSLLPAIVMYRQPVRRVDAGPRHGRSSGGHPASGSVSPQAIAA